MVEQRSTPRARSVPPELISRTQGVHLATSALPGVIKVWQAERHVTIALLEPIARKFAPKVVLCVAHVRKACTNPTQADHHATLVRQGPTNRLGDVHPASRAGRGSTARVMVQHHRKRVFPVLQACTNRTQAGRRVMNV